MRKILLAGIAAGTLLSSTAGFVRADDVLDKGYEAKVQEALLLREEPGFTAPAVDTLKPGSFVYIEGDAKVIDGMKWFPVEQDLQRGWVSSIFLTPREYTEEVATTAAAPATIAASADERSTTTTSSRGATTQVTPKLTPKTEAVVTDHLRLRAKPGTDAEALTTLPLGSLVYVQEGPEMVGTTQWFKVGQDSFTGWVLADYVASWTSDAATKARVSRAARPATSSPATSSPTTGSNERRTTTTASTASGTSSRGATTSVAPAVSNRGGGVAGTAFRYVGYPYALGAVGPRAFDCSGFTSHVMAQYGVSLGRTTYAQWAGGRAVSTSQLAPGDLVFFANTFGPGISHVGIYVGGGQMVHAGSERTGVTVSSIFDAYWGGHYAGARRYL